MLSAARIREFWLGTEPAVKAKSAFIDGFYVLRIGVFAYAAWTLTRAFGLFMLLKHTVDLRVKKEEEIMGLDLGEHGTVGYADFVLKM